MKKLAMMLMLAALAEGCARRTDTANHQRVSAPVSRSDHRPRPTAPRRTTLDPTSTRAASDLVQAFVQLINQRKFDEAYMLLGSEAPPRSEFDRKFSRVAQLQVSAGDAGDQEGAAGSIYISIPLNISGTTGGRTIHRPATAILRRVNQVPGSTEAQRHWHIERIEWGS